MHNRLPPLLIATALSAAIATALAQPPEHAAGGPPMFGKGNPFTIEDLPRGRTKARLESLPAPARARALGWLHRFEFPANDLQAITIDDQGGILYADPSPFNCFSPLCPKPPAEAGETTAADGSDSTSPEPAATAAEDAFFLNSRPGATNTVYLDFDGQTFSNTAWSSGTIYAKPFDTDGSPSTFSAAERAAIAEIWHRVAEDLAPFDINVTTEEPASFGPRVGRVLVTSKTQTNGSAMPYNTGGGVAYVGVFGSSNYGYYSPALVYYDNLAKNPTYIAEASSHEFGHNLGLSHDGNASTTYYAGHGSGNTSWAPIMGNSYYNNVTQWSKGEYSGANNTQDDLAIIAGKLDLAGDDHGDEPGTATALSVGTDGQVLASNPELDPHNTYWQNKGVIDHAGDRDLFAFSVAAGKVELAVNPAWDAFYRTSRRGANLDIQAQLLDGQGQVLASSDPTDDTHAAVSISVAAGTYYLAVEGVGNGSYTDYASAGQYFVSGIVPAGAAPNAPPTAGFNYGCSELNCSFSDASIDNDGSVVAWAWDFGDGHASTARNPSHGYAAAGSYNVSLTVTDDDGAKASTNATLTFTAEQPNAAPDANFSASCAGLECSFTDASSDSDGKLATWAWDFGDGHTSTAQSPRHAYAAGGSYNVKLAVTDDAGASSSISRSVTVTEPASQATLQVSSRKIRGAKYFDLAWTGLGGDTVTITRKRNNDAAVPQATANDGKHTDSVDGGGSYVYQACDADGVCTPAVTASL